MSITAAAAPRTGCRRREERHLHVSRASERANERGTPADRPRRATEGALLLGPPAVRRAPRPCATQTHAARARGPLVRPSVRPPVRRAATRGYSALRRALGGTASGPVHRSRFLAKAEAVSTSSLNSWPLQGSQKMDSDGRVWLPVFVTLLSWLSVFLAIQLSYRNFNRRRCSPNLEFQFKAMLKTGPDTDWSR